MCRTVVVVTLCGLWASADVAFAVEQDMTRQFLSMFASVGWLAAFALSLRYLYTSSGGIQPGSIFDSRWPLKIQMKPKWFRIGD